MLLVDTAVGSKELAEPLRALGLPVEETRLESGDLAFMGRGVGGAPVYVGIEYKKLPELVGSLRTERLQGHQIPAMILAGFDRRYLLVEGDFHHDKQGRVVQYRKGRQGAVPVKGAPNALALEKELLSLQVRCGLITRHVTTRADSLRVIQAWYRWWTDRDLDAHKSHLAVYAPDMDPEILQPMSDFRRAIQVLLPGVGFAASRAIEDAFGGSWAMMVAATEDEWAELEIPDAKGKVKRFGAARAKKVMEVLQ